MPPAIVARVFKVGDDSSTMLPAISPPALPPNPPTTLTTGALAPDIALIPAGIAPPNALIVPPPANKLDATLAYSISFCSASVGCVSFK